ncbi:hypothetical protein L6164_023960 [Bauhinia variegata]|uniref:Uncharacterized protein n=1 Tax=Bauhinia variegata TaxID=167791 RepID=A0ACB9LXJ0_BAUVA|nr:hypothetical protein L6164_023960 [Bauhinia variegata]
MEVPPVTAAGHVVVVPYPSRGHINPMMNLSKLLVSKNRDILVTFVVTEQWLGVLSSEPRPRNIQVCSISNLMSPEMAPMDFLDMVEAVMTKMEAPFERLLDRLEPPPTIIIYDNFLFWVLSVGNRRNIPVASFWTTSTLCFWVQQHYHLLEKGDFLENGEELVDCIPGIHPIRVAEIPFLDGSWQSQKIIQWVKKASHWVPKAQYLLFYSIYELEAEVIDILKNKFSLPIYAIVPTMDYFSHEGNSLNSRINNRNYLHWLDCQPSKSVLYISHGSCCSVSSAQIEEIAAALCDSGIRFLWIAREEASRLKEICGDVGLVLAWCDQLRVLLHPAIGGFWTHCGWNSTMEGVFAGVPFLTFPITMDQALNSKIIVEDWKVGWRVKKDAEVDTLVRKDEIAEIVTKFMDLESDLGRNLRKKAKELQQIFHLAIANHGSNETNINAFVNEIIEVSCIKG